MCFYVAELVFIESKKVVFYVIYLCLIAYLKFDILYMKQNLMFYWAKYMFYEIKCSYFMKQSMLGREN